MFFAQDANMCSGAMPRGLAGGPGRQRQDREHQRPRQISKADLLFYCTLCFFAYTNTDSLFCYVHVALTTVCKYSVQRVYGRVLYCTVRCACRWPSSVWCSTVATRWTTARWPSSSRAWRCRAPGPASPSSTASSSTCSRSSRSRSRPFSATWPSAPQASCSTTPVTLRIQY